MVSVGMIVSIFLLGAIITVECATVRQNWPNLYSNSIYGEGLPDLAPLHSAYAPEYYNNIVPQSDSLSPKSENADSVPFQKRAYLRLGKRAYMRLGKRAEMEKRARLRLG